MSFSEAVKKIREDANLSQADLAELLGVCRATINRWEMGAQKPSKIALRLLLEYCEKNGIEFNGDA